MLSIALLITSLACATFTLVRVVTPEPTVIMAGSSWLPATTALLHAATGLASL